MRTNRSRTPVSVTTTAALALLILAGGCGDDSEGPRGSAPTPSPTPIRGSTVPAPSLEGPVKGGAGVPRIAATTFDLAEFGYSQREYFISGTATAYKAIGPIGSYGQWNAVPEDEANYKTRIVVHRPRRAADFNGTAVVEWLNVSAGIDGAPDWIMMHTELIRQGYAWVGVSAEKVGVEGGQSVWGLPSVPLKELDPERYASLSHPSNRFSYDIFSQAGRLLLTPPKQNPLGDLHVEKVLAVGASESADRMVSYINAVHPIVELYDGFLVHSRSFASAPIFKPPQTPVTPAVLIREDVSVPVMIFQTETDVAILESATIRQPDSEHIRLWEVAGTAQADAYTIVTGPADLGDSSSAARLILTSTPLAGFRCALPINSGPHHIVLKAAVRALHRWVRGGPPPPSAPTIEVEPDGYIRLSNGGMAPAWAIRRDEYGNALGGIRTPPLDVPTAVLSGEGEGELIDMPVFCILLGQSAPFSVETLRGIYADHGDYVAQYNAATDAAVDAGFVLPEEAALMKAAAELSFVPGTEDGIAPEEAPATAKRDRCPFLAADLATSREVTALAAQR